MILPLDASLDSNDDLVRVARNESGEPQWIGRIGPGDYRLIDERANLLIFVDAHPELSDFDVARLVAGTSSPPQRVLLSSTETEAATGELFHHLQECFSEYSVEHLADKTRITFPGIGVALRPVDGLGMRYLTWVSEWEIERTATAIGIQEHAVATGTLLDRYK